MLRKMKDQVPPHLYAIKRIKKVDRPTFDRGTYTWLVDQKRFFVIKFELSGKFDPVVCGCKVGIGVR